MPKQVRSVHDMEIDEISLVDRPANQHARVAIAKRASQEDTVPDEYFTEDGSPVEDLDQLEVGDVVYDTDGNAFQAQVDDEAEDIDYADDDDLVEVGKAYNMRRFTSAAGYASRRAASAHNAEQGAAHAAGGGFAGSAKESAQAFGGGRMRGAASNAGDRVFGYGRTARRRKIGAGAAAGAGAAGAGGYEAHRRVNKSLADEVREALSKAATEDQRDEVIAKALDEIAYADERAAQAEAIAKAERDLRLEREYIAKAAEYNVPVEPDELGPVLMHAAESLSYEDCAVLHKALSAAGEMLFTEAGYTGQADNLDPYAQVEAYVAEQALSKSAGGEQLSKAQAIADFFSTNPAAYDEYVASLGQ